MVKADGVSLMRHVRRHRGVLISVTLCIVAALAAVSVLNGQDYADLLQWLRNPADASRVHAISPVESWHARLMVVAWAVLLPIGILVARYFKITRKQSWPERLDNQLWWRTHLTCQYVGGVFVLLSAGLIVFIDTSAAFSAHAMVGWLVLGLTAVQFVSGWTRGSKGGPSELSKTGSLRGDHYDMTPRRCLFEYLHKLVGYSVLLLASVAIVLGLVLTNAPRWIWLVIVVCWLGLTGIAVMCQRRGRAIDTYQAIWGPDPTHPGNQRKPIGIGISRPFTHR